MNTIFYWLGRAIIAVIQKLSLLHVARLGRFFGALAFRLDARHRRVALDNLNRCFGPEKSAAEIHAIARENFCRIGENYLCAIKTSAMTADGTQGARRICQPRAPAAKSIGDAPPRNVVVAIGHFGNFELYARFHDHRAGLPVRHHLPRAQPARLQPADAGVARHTSGCLYFERRKDGELLRAAMHQGGIILGLLADQSSKGLHGPFLGHDCNTGLAPAVLALRYNTDLYSAICYRVAPAQWRVEVGEAIPTHENGHPRPSAEIMRDVNRALEAAVRRDPANWFWVHRRWKG
jgi:KDO2-lipid IV(A) lauroyltransferase